MHQRHLKTIRVILALLFILATGFIFIDFRELLPKGLINGITFLQFLPSVLKFFTSFCLLATGFIVVLVLTAFFGRIYCSAICPLGIFQDAVSWIRKKTRRKHRYRFGKPQNWWRYGFLVLPLLILLVGKSLIGISLLDPYSIFGRIASDLVPAGLHVAQQPFGRCTGAHECLFSLSGKYHACQGTYLRDPRH